MFNKLKKIVILDPYQLYGFGIKMIIEKENDLIVNQITNTSQELIKHVKSDQPDLLIVSSVHYTADIISLLQRIIERFPELSVLLIADPEASYFKSRRGDTVINGVVFCDAKPEKMISAIYAVLAGKEYFPEVILDRKSQKRKYTKRNGNDKESIIFPLLTGRESEILSHFAQGQTYKEIANQLFISVRTVETHKKNIIAKLGLHTKTDIIKYAMVHHVV